MARTKNPAFAILRFDEMHGVDVETHELVTVTGVVATEEAAQREVDRLNELNADKGAIYRWQTTRIVNELE